MNRREFLKTTLAAGAAAGLPCVASGLVGASAHPRASADAMILIWLPGGVAQTDTWDPKKYTPYTPGMKGSDLLGTCPIIPTSADGILFGAGLDHLASVMHHGTVLRSVVNDTPFGDVHLKAQHHAMTGYRFPSGVRPPSMGAVVARTLGRRDPSVPAYVLIGGDASNAPESAFIQEYEGSGFYGPQFAPLRIADPAASLSDERTIAMSSSNGAGHGFAAGCPLARRMVEAGARFVQVQYPYEAFDGFDAHEHGGRRIAEIKRRIDVPIAQLIHDLDDRGLLERTLVVVMSEFGRTIAAGDDLTAERLTIRDESQYGFHGHFSAANAMLFFGGGFKRGFAYGRTADRHPMIVVEKPVRIEDVHATMYAALGIAPDAHYMHDGEAVSVTNGGKPIDALLA